MADFNDIELRRLDLTLLLVFEETMASGKLSAAARRLGLTQSAISHALKRLRGIFADELFVRTPHGVRPTPRALALREPLSEALDLIGGAVRPATFDPARDSRVFRIAAPDYETSLFAPLLATQGSPSVIFHPLVREAAVAALLAGDLDLVLGNTASRGACEAVTLYEEDYLVVGRPGHPALAPPPDMDRYVAAGHVLTAPGGTATGIVDTALAAQGRTRRVAVTVPYFLAALATVARTDLITTLPRRLAQSHAASFGLASARPPLSVRAFPVRMLWSRRAASDPGLAWLRSEIMRAAACEGVAETGRGA